MGFHTWFYNRVDLTFEEAQQKARDYVHFCIELNKETYNDSLNETDPFMKEHLLSLYDPDYEKKLSKIWKRLRKEIIITFVKIYNMFQIGFVMPVMVLQY